MIVLSSNYVLASSSSEGDGVDANSPMIGYHNTVALGNIVADTEEDDYPVGNVTNPLTGNEWRAEDTTEQYLTHTVPGSVDMNYVGIARHNLGSAGIAVSVEVDEGSGYEEVAALIPADDAPIIFHWNTNTPVGVRIKLGSGDEPARIAVVFMGRLIRPPRNLYVGHRPITLARKDQMYVGASSTGNYLGAVQLGQYNESTAQFQNVDPGWYRNRMEPFVRNGVGTPFFWAWRPDDYPLEVGYCWFAEAAAPDNQLPNGMMSFSIPTFRGIVS